jgi:hypothetical protein
MLDVSFRPSVLLPNLRTRVTREIIALARMPYDLLHSVSSNGWQDTVKRE